MTTTTLSHPVQEAAAHGLDPLGRLELPWHQRMVVQRHPLPEGGTELRLYYGDKEISFDEPGMFAFGETLSRQSSFIAGSACSWGSGYRWEEIEPLLAELIEQGVLRHQEAATQPLRMLELGDRPAPLPAGTCPQARSWFDSEAITTELTGRPLDTCWLEMVIPIFRVAHPALDGDGRQVGEANVFPPALRMDISTRWRACIYPGTRFQTGRPMNVTALKGMREHWPVMMWALQQVRLAYLRRFPDAAQAWTVGHLERLATAVLAVPTYQLMRCDRPATVLHPALSSLFRVTDGLRMTMHQMLFVPIGEPTLSPDTPLTAADILAYAERNHSFHSEHGVCAGPQAMIEEFLGVVVDGQAPRHEARPDAVMQAALGDVEQALDYALLGLQVHAAVFSLWPAMTRSYEQLVSITEAVLANGGDTGTRAWQSLDARLRASVAQVRSSTYLAHEAWRVDREKVYDDMWAQCARGMGQATAADALSSALARRRPLTRQALEVRLHTLLRDRLGRADGNDHAALIALRSQVFDFMARAQDVLRAATVPQLRINALLGRPAAKRVITAADIDIHNQLQAQASRRLPYLLSELEDELGLLIHISPESMDVQQTLFDAPAPAGRHPDSSDMVSAERHADRMQSTRS